MTETFSSLWRKTGGMSLKDAGVEATMFLCSSGEINGGRVEIRVNGAMVHSDMPWDTTDEASAGLALAVHVSA